MKLRRKQTRVKKLTNKNQIYFESRINRLFQLETEIHNKLKKQFVIVKGNEYYAPGHHNQICLEVNKFLKQKNIMYTLKKINTKKITHLDKSMVSIISKFLYHQRNIYIIQTSKYTKVGKSESCNMMNNLRRYKNDEIVSISLLKFENM